MLIDPELSKSTARLQTTSRTSLENPNLSKLFSKTELIPCRRCEKTITSFFGKLYCDECIAILDEEQARRNHTAEIKARIEKAVARELLHPDTTTIAFETASPPRPENAASWDKAVNAPFTKNLYLFGNPGTGKTYLARCLLMRDAAAGRSVAEASIRRIVKTADRFDEGKGWLLALEKTGTLLLDDFDKLQWTANALSVVWELLNERAANNRRTIVTANMSLSDMIAMMIRSSRDNPTMVESTIDRLAPLDIIEFTGTSRRSENGIGI